MFKVCYYNYFALSNILMTYYICNYSPGGSSVAPPKQLNVLTLYGFCINNCLTMQIKLLTYLFIHCVPKKGSHLMFDNRACKLLKFVSMVSMFLTISGGKQYVFGPIILIINRN